MDYWKRLQTEIGTNTRKGSEIFIKQFLQKKTENSFSDFPVLWMFWILTSIYVGRKSGKTKQFGKLIGWADLFLVCSDIHTESTSKKMICGFFLNLLECSNKATFLEQKGTKLEQWFSSAFCLLSLQKQFKTETKQKRKANFESRFGFFNLSKKRNTKSSDKLRKNPRKQVFCFLNFFFILIEKIEKEKKH